MDGVSQSEILRGGVLNVRLSRDVLGKRDGCPRYAVANTKRLVEFCFGGRIESLQSFLGEMSYAVHAVWSLGSWDAPFPPKQLRSKSRGKLGEC